MTVDILSFGFDFRLYGPQRAHILKLCFGVVGLEQCCCWVLLPRNHVMNRCDLVDFLKFFGCDETKCASEYSFLMVFGQLFKLMIVNLTENSD